MKYKVDHDYHIHSMLSSCSSDPQQTTERILKYAKDNGFRSICLTDHYWDSAVKGASGWYAPQNFEHISKALPLPTACGVDFLFGCETDMDRNFTLGIPKERFSDFDFVIIPTTHLHMTGFTIFPEDKESTERRAALWIERLDSLISQDLPWGKIGIAHLACSLINTKSRTELMRTLELIPSGEMERLFSRAASLGVGIELNSDDMSFADDEEDTVLRMFKIAKHQGCKFYLGSDAHNPPVLDAAVDIFERAVTLLGLEESDKFHIQ